MLEEPSAPIRDMEVPGTQVGNFLSTLRDYSDNCAAARKSVEEALEEGNKRDAEWKKDEKIMVTEMKKAKDEVHKAIQNHGEEMSEVRDSIENFETRIQIFNKHYNEVLRIMERMEVKESFICLYLDISKESERLTCTLFTTTIYAGNICREIETFCP